MEFNSYNAPLTPRCSFFVHKKKPANAGVVALTEFNRQQMML